MKELGMIDPSEGLKSILTVGNTFETSLHFHIFACFILNDRISELRWSSMNSNSRKINHIRDGRIIKNKFNLCQML